MALFPRHQFPVLPFALFLFKGRQGLSSNLGMSVTEEMSQLGLKAFMSPFPSLTAEHPVLSSFLTASPSWC